MLFLNAILEFPSLITKYQVNVRDFQRRYLLVNSLQQKVCSLMIQLAFPKVELRSNTPNMLLLANYFQSFNSRVFFLYRLYLLLNIVQKRKVEAKCSRGILCLALAFQCNSGYHLPWVSPQRLWLFVGTFLLQA